MLKPIKLTQEQFDEIFGGHTDEEDALIMKSEQDTQSDKIGETVVSDDGDAYFTAVYSGWITNMVKIPNERFDWDTESEAEQLKRKSLCLNNIYKQAVEKQLISDRGSLIVITDSPLKGYIYECGNYGKGKWSFLGKTNGYA